MNVTSLIPEVDRAISSAAAFLDDARSDDFLWRDFQTLAGESCDWVSGFVAFATASSGVLREAVGDSTRALLRRQRPSGGWAYNERVPPDCDSTAWVLLAISTTTIWKPSIVLHALKYVRRHATDRGFSTYTREDRIDEFIQARPEQTAGWLSPHICVTAVALQALLIHGLGGDPVVRQLLCVLRAAQDDDGLWRSYWWRGAPYATSQSLRALAAAGELTHDIWNRASEGLMREQNSDGGWGDVDSPSHAFATAMALNALSTRPDPRCTLAVDAAAEWLVERQRQGHWTPEPILCIPPPFAVTPDVSEFRVDELGTGVLLRDQNGIFTTAAVLAALVVYRDCARLRLNTAQRLHVTDTAAVTAASTTHL